MQRRFIVLIVYLHIALGCVQPPLQAGESPSGRIQSVDSAVGVDYKPIRLPLSVKSARSWISLHETRLKPPPDQAPLGVVIRTLQQAANRKNPHLMFYLEPRCLSELEITMATPIAAPVAAQDEIALKRYLTLLLTPLALGFVVHDDLVIIDSECHDCPNRLEVSAKEAWTWFLLHEELPLHFPTGTPLERVLKQVQQHTTGKVPGTDRIGIHIDLGGVERVGETLNTPVYIDIECIPICTALSLVLKQLGLVFRVTEDGLVIVTGYSDNLEADMDETYAIQSYNTLLYDLFLERRRAVQDRKATIPKPDGLKGGPVSPATRQKGENSRSAPINRRNDKIK